MTSADGEDAKTRTDHKRGSGVKYVYDILRDEILDLTLPPGSPIDETRLSQRLKMSRTPIREALVRLAAEGLVTTLPNRSTIVAHIDMLNLQPFFDALTLMYRLTARLAAENHTDADLREIRANQAAFAASVQAQDALGMISANRDFHASISEAGRNPYFTHMFCRLLDEGRRLLRIYYRSFDDQLPHEYVEEHETMISAIAARDIETADRVGKDHADQIVRAIQLMVTRDTRHDFPI